MKVAMNEFNRSKSEAILEGLLDTGHKTADLLLPLVGKFLSVRYNSYANVRARMLGHTYHLEEQAREDAKRAEYQRFQNSLQYLRREGFVVGERHGRSFFWNLTEAGRTHLMGSKANRERYKKEKTNMVFIVSYDIPESDRRHRDWIRGILKFLDFSMVHKSVWLGSNKIPEDFLHDLRRKNIFSYVHIFEVGKGGTLTQLN